MTDQKEHTNDNQENDNFEVIKLLYERASCDWRHYDNHIWQIPSLAVAINSFLVGQAFNPDLINSTFNCVVPSMGNLIVEPYRIVRALIIFLALCFTFVLTIALTKHRLHERAKDLNLINLENSMKYKTQIFSFDDPKVLNKVEPQLTLLERWLAPRKAHRYLIAIMGLTMLVDGILFLSILLLGW